MNNSEYSKQAMTFARFDHSDYPLVALGEEAGEVLGKFAKYGRKQGVTMAVAVNHCRHSKTEAARQLRKDILAELGDVQWQLNALSQECGFSLNDVMSENIDKLSGRKERNTLVGEGDNR